MIFPAIGYGPAADNQAMALYYLVWAIFAAIVLVATLKSQPLSIVLLYALFMTWLFLLNAYWWSNTNLRLLKALGYVGLAAAFFAFYSGTGIFLNDIYRTKGFIPMMYRS